MKTGLLICISLLTLISQAQVKIVKDNLACLYGLKHTSGEWIVKPEYTLIANLNPQIHIYRTLKNHKYGLMDSKGKIMVDNLYDQITENQYHTKYLEIRIGQKKGVMDTTGRIIIPMDDYYDIAMKPHDFFIAYRRDGYFLYKGENLFSKKPFDRIQANVLDHKMHFNLIDFKRKHKTWKNILIGPEFDTLLITENTEISVHWNHLIVKYRDSLLIYENANQLKYTLRFQGILYGNDLSFQNENEKFRYTENGKMGIADLKGNIILPPKYDLINFLNPSNPVYKYQVQLSGKVGFLNENFEEVIPPEYGQVSKNGHDDLMFLSKNGKLGIFDLYGKQLAQPIYTYITDGKYNHFLYDTTNIYKLNTDLSSTKIDFYEKRMVRGTFKVKLGAYSIYDFNGTLFAFSQYTNYFDFYPGISVYFHDNKYKLYMSGGNTLYYDADGTEVFPEKIKINKSWPLSDDYSIFYNEYGKYGIIYRNDSIVIPAQYQSMRPATLNIDPLVWIKKGGNENCRFREKEAGNWYLCRPDGSIYVDLVFDIPADILLEKSPVYVNGKCGLYDFKNRKFILDPIYDHINENTGMGWYKFITDVNGEFLIANGNYKLMSEKKWKYMIGTKKPFQLPGKNRHINTPSFFYVFMNDTDSLALNLFGDTISESTFLKKLIYEGNYLTPSDPNYGSLIYGLIKCTQQQLEKNRTTIDEVFTKLMLKDEIGIRKIPETEWVHLNIEGMNTKFQIKVEKGNHYFAGTLNYCNEDYVSITNWSFSIKSNNRYYNYYRAYGYLFEFGLKDIFRQDVNIEDAMIILLSESIHGRDDLFLDCHNPKTIFDLTEKVFSFNADGLIFKIKDQNHQERDILVSWKKLKKYAPEKGIVADFIKMENN